MHLWTRVSIGSLLAVAAGSAGWLALRNDVQTKPHRQLLTEEEAHGPPDSLQMPEEPEEPLVSVETGVSPSVPVAYLEKVPTAKTEELAALIEDWLEHDGNPKVSYQRGLVYVESEEDRGDDGPYPRSAKAEAIHACGSQAVWLRSHMRRQLSYVDHFSCAQNVCSYGGMEYAPNGDLIFHMRPDGEWELRGWVLDYQAALGESVQQENAASVHAGLMKLRNAKCADEPDGQYY